MVNHDGWYKGHPTLFEPTVSSTSTFTSDLFGLYWWSPGMIVTYIPFVCPKPLNNLFNTTSYSATLCIVRSAQVTSLIVFTTPKIFRHKFGNFFGSCDPQKRFTEIVKSKHQSIAEIYVTIVILQWVWFCFHVTVSTAWPYYLLTL